jgi:hypothetical protein
MRENMMMLCAILLNEFMAVLTMAIVFPALLNPKVGMDWFFLFFLLIPLSAVWWLYLALCPIAFLIIYIFDKLELNYWTESFPWKYLVKRNNNVKNK